MFLSFPPALNGRVLYGTRKRGGEKGHLHKFDIWQLFAWLVKSRGGRGEQRKARRGEGLVVENFERSRL